MAISGPLPDPNHRHRNAPTIPTTVLPACGRRGPAPKPPAWITLETAGKAWWRWAWRTPQAAAWGPGHEVTVAHRASLEDDLAKERGPRMAVRREMRELDDRLGLSPKGMAALRWTIVPDDDQEQTPASAPAAVAHLDDRRNRLLGAS